jgi:hypothetical protein
MSENLEHLVPDENKREEAVVAGVEELVVVPAEPADWHVEAGRKGARRFHELVQRGRLYEQQHGLKSGRQRLRQLVELGKLYEEENGLRPARKRKRTDRLARGEREELIATLLRCLLHIAKPSLRGDLLRLIDAMNEKVGEAA